MGLPCSIACSQDPVVVALGAIGPAMGHGGTGERRFRLIQGHATFWRGHMDVGAREAAWTTGHDRSSVSGGDGDMHNGWIVQPVAQHAN